MGLYAHIYNSNWATPTFKEDLGEIFDLQTTWENPGGVQRFMFSTRQVGASAYQGFSTWEGNRCIITDHFCDRPVVEGTVVYTELWRGKVVVAVAGPWWRMFDDYEAHTPGAINNDDMIETAILNHATTIDGTDVSDCGSTASVNGFGYSHPVGMHPGRIVEEVMRMGDGSGSPLVFWIEPQAFDGMTPQKPKAYLIPIVTTDTVDWQVWARDKVAGTNILARDIGDLATSVVTTWNDAGNPKESVVPQTNNTSKYWTRERAASGRGAFDDTSSTEIAEMMVKKLSNAQVRLESVIGAREITDRYGGKWPIWRMLIGGGYIRDNDVRPERSLFDTSYDFWRVGRICSMRYDQLSRQMRITLNDRLDLDWMLARFGYEWRITEQTEREMIPYKGS